MKEEIDNRIGEITDLLDKIAVEFKDKKRGEWTQEIKQRLIALGKQQKPECKIATTDDNGNADRSSEWLCDLIWWRDKGDGDMNEMTSIELAVESEWDRNSIGIENDFLKLVYLKARLKLFIFDALSEEECKNTRERLQNLADMCEDKDNGKYLFSCTIRDNGDKFEHSPPYPATP